MKRLTKKEARLVVLNTEGIYNNIKKEHLDYYECFNQYKMAVFMYPDLFKKYWNV